MSLLSRHKRLMNSQGDDWRGQQNEHKRERRKNYNRTFLAELWILFARTPTGCSTRVQLHFFCVYYMSQGVTHRVLKFFTFLYVARPGFIIIFFPPCSAESNQDLRNSFSLLFLGEKPVSCIKRPRLDTCKFPKEGARLPAANFPCVWIYVFANFSPLRVTEILERNILSMLSQLLALKRRIK